MSSFKVYRSQDGRDFIIADGGRVIVKSGATISVEAGAIVEGLSTTPGDTPAEPAESAAQVTLSPSRWDRLSVSLLTGYGAGNVAVQRLVGDVNVNGALFAYGFLNPDVEDGDVSTIHFSVPMPTSYKLGSPIIPVMLYSFFNEDPPAGVEPETFSAWELELYFFGAGSLPGGGYNTPEELALTVSTIYLSGEVSALDKERNHIYPLTFPNCTPATAIYGATLLGRLTRTYTAVPGDDFTGIILVPDLMLYYEMDTIAGASSAAKE